MRVVRWRWGWGAILGALLFSAGPVAAGILDATWTAPTTNTDGSPLTDLGFYRVYYGSVDPPCTGSTFVTVPSPTTTPQPNQQVGARLSGLTTGTLYRVAVTAVDAGGAESACSTSASATAHVDVTVSPTTTVNFGSVNVGSSADRTFTVTNTVGGTVSGTVSVSAPFSVVSGGSFSLVGLNAAQNVTVRFAPTALVTSTTNVNFAADGDTISRTVTGVGTGNDTTSPSVAITSPTGTPTFSTSSASVALAGTASDDVGVTQVTWANDRGGSGAASGTANWTVSSVTLQLGTNVLTITARDAAGNVGTDTLTVTRDTTAPSVSMTAPLSGATVFGTVAVTATATDGVGVVGVQFLLDGANLGAEIATPPYSVAWNTGTVANGGHTLSARARDAAGNSTVSAGVSVTVANVAPAGLVAAYSFNEGSGSTVTDASGNNNTGSVSGAAWTTAGKFGNALVFNGQNNLVSIPDSPSLHLTTGMTLEAWVKPSAVTSAWRDVIYKGNDNYYLEATSTSSGMPVGGGTWSSGAKSTTGTAALAMSTWSHLAVTYDGATLRLFVNGAEASNAAKTGSLSTSTNPLQIGGDSIFGQFFSGTIDEVRVYNRALSQAQIQTDMNTAVGSSPFVFSDDPLTAQMPVKAVHMTELRTAIDSLRVGRGLRIFAWTDPTLTVGSTTVRGVHLLELRTALNQVYQAAGRPAPTYTDPSIPAGVVLIKAVHINELRAGVAAIQ